MNNEHTLPTREPDFMFRLTDKHKAKGWNVIEDGKSHFVIAFKFNGEQVIYAKSGELFSAKDFKQHDEIYHSLLVGLINKYAD